MVRNEVEAMKLLSKIFLAFGLLALVPTLGHAQGVTRVCTESVNSVTGQNNCQDVSASNPFPVNASVSVGGFAPGGAYATPLSVSNSTGNVALPAGTEVVVYNVGANAVYVKLGTSNAVTATTSDDYIPSGGALALTVGSNTYLAAITGSSTSTLNISGGTGLPTGWGGGGSSGGGTVTQGTAASSGPWIFTPWIASAVNSATNGTYENLLQGNAVLSATNGLYTNLLQGNAVLSSSNPIFATLEGPLGAQTTAASVAVVSKPNNYAPLGYQQITAGTLASSTTLTVPATSTIAVIQVEAAGVRWRDDGTAPTATVGMLLAPGNTLTLSGAAELAAVAFILSSGSPILDVSYYK